MTTPSAPTTPTGPGAPRSRGSRMQRFRASRGVKKFRRNRLAMVSLAVIAVYALLASWIVCMEVAAWAGKATKMYDLKRSPVLSMFLPTEVARRVGPPKVAGFGREQPAHVRANQYNVMRALAETPIKAAASLGTDSERTPRAILDDAAMTERRLADVPLAELQAELAGCETLFADYDALSKRVSALQNAAISARKARAALRALRDTPADETEEGKTLTKRLRTDALDQVEETGFAVEAFADLVEDSEVFAGVDADAIADFALAVEDGEDPGEPLDETLRTVERKARAGVDGFAPGIDAKLDLIGASIDRLWPMPRGAKGLLYRFRMLLGTDRQGRSILVRALYSAKIALQVGLLVAVVSVGVGAVVGAAAAFFGGWVDHAIIWVYSTLSSIPYLVLLSLLAFVFHSSEWTLPWDNGVKVSATLIPLYAAFCITFWIGPCRVIRGETLKLKQLEYVQAATAIGFGRFTILLRHVLPNTAHLMFINLSLLLIAAIKSEVILTFLGLGLKEGSSWGMMISQSKSDVIEGFFWEMGAATFFMFVLVLTFNIVSDAMQDAFDPRHVG